MPGAPREGRGVLGAGAVQRGEGRGALTREFGMTEAEWLEGADPDAMIDHLAGLGHGRTGAGKRRLRLFACACCRRVWPRLDAESREAVEAGERFADGLLGKEDLARVEKATLHRGWAAGAD